MTEYNYRAELVRVVDGDTVRLRLYKDIDIGFHILQTISTEMNFRLARINTPEVRGIEKEAGLKAKAYVEECLNKSQYLRAITYKPDKYGRWLIDLYFTIDGEEILLNDHLLKEGYADVYK